LELPGVEIFVDVVQVKEVEDDADELRLVEGRLEEEIADRRRSLSAILLRWDFIAAIFRSLLEFI
jgi:hypothetical protein